MSRATLDVELVNRLPELERLAAALQAFAAEHHVPDEVVSALRVALEEVVVNVIHHGYDDGGNHLIRVRFDLADREWTVVVEDDARAYDPFSRADPDLDLPIEDRPIGGLGVYLVKELMDSAEYRREREKNILTLKKRWA